MSLSPDEFRAHLALASATAGLTLPDLVLPTAHHVILRGMRFHYLDWGTRGRAPMLFLHGGGLNVHTWDLVCAALRLERHCLALDQRGHGDAGRISTSTCRRASAAGCGAGSGAAGWRCGAG